MKMKDIEVFQANAFIESRQSYTLYEKRLLSTLIGFVKPTDAEFAQYEISIQDWAKMLKISPKGLYKIADDVTTGLMQKIVSVKDTKRLKFKKWHVMETADYADGILRLKIDRKMNDMFLDLKSSKRYTHYELIEFVTLTSTHAQRIYELIMQYQHHPKREREIELTELRKMLGLGEKRYRLFSDFRRHVLEISKKQIEENTSLRFEWEGVTHGGRKIRKIKFSKINSGKNIVSEKQEEAFLSSYIGEEIFYEKFNLYFMIKKIEKKGGKYFTKSKDDDTWYEFESLKFLQEGIALAIPKK